MSEEATMTFRKFFTLTAWLAWISMRSSASSWKHFRRPWLEVYLPKILMDDVPWLYCLVMQHPNRKAFLRNIYRTTKWWIPFEAAFCCWRSPKICQALLEDSAWWCNLCFQTWEFPTMPISFLFFDAHFQTYIKYSVNSVGISWSIFENGP